MGTHDLWKHKLRLKSSEYVLTEQWGRHDATFRITMTSSDQSHCAVNVYYANPPEKMELASFGVQDSANISPKTRSYRVVCERGGSYIDVLM